MVRNFVKTACLNLSAVPVARYKVFRSAYDRFHRRERPVVVDLDVLRAAVPRFYGRLGLESGCASGILSSGCLILGPRHGSMYDRPKAWAIGASAEVSGTGPSLTNQIWPVPPDRMLCRAWIELEVNGMALKAADVDLRRARGAGRPSVFDCF